MSDDGVNLVCNMVVVGKLPSPHGRSPNVTNLAALYEIVQSSHCFLEERVSFLLDKILYIEFKRKPTPRRSHCPDRHGESEEDRYMLYPSVRATPQPG
jgi:hypothetical protein